MTYLSIKVPCFLFLVHTWHSHSVDVAQEVFAIKQADSDVTTQDVHTCNQAPIILLWVLQWKSLFYWNTVKKNQF